MNMKRFFLFVCLFFMTALAGGLSYAGETHQLYMGRSQISDEAALPHEEITIERANGEHLYFDVELAVTPEEQARGLMFRTEMQDYAGMLFVFGDVQMRSFWMKNTLIPLDMLFIAQDGTVHHIHHNARPQDETIITSFYPSLAVLELKGGTCDRLDIVEGDRVVYGAFRNENLAE